MLFVPAIPFTQDLRNSKDGDAAELEESYPRKR